MLFLFHHRRLFTITLFCSFPHFKHPFIGRKNLQSFDNTINQRSTRALPLGHSSNRYRIPRWFEKINRVVSVSRILQYLTNFKYFVVVCCPHKRTGAVHQGWWPHASVMKRRVQVPAVRCHYHRRSSSFCALTCKYWSINLTLIFFISLVFYNH